MDTPHTVNFASPTFQFVCYTVLSIAEFIVLVWRDKVDSSIGLSCRPDRLQAGRPVLRYTHKTSGFKTSGFKTSETSCLQNVRFTKFQVYKTTGLQNVRLQKKHP